METLKKFSALIAGLSGNAGGTTARMKDGAVVFGRRKTHTSGVSDPHTPWRRIMAVMERCWEELPPAGREAWLNGCPVPGLSGRDYFGRTNYWQVALHDGYLSAPTGEDLRVAPRAARPGLTPLSADLKDALCLEWVELPPEDLGFEAWSRFGVGLGVNPQEAWDRALEDYALAEWHIETEAKAESWGRVDQNDEFMFTAQLVSWWVHLRFRIRSAVFGYWSTQRWTLNAGGGGYIPSGAFQIEDQVYGPTDKGVVERGAFVRARAGEHEILATTAEDWVFPLAPPPLSQVRGWFAVPAYVSWRVRERLPVA